MSLLKTLLGIINRKGLRRLYSGLGADTLSTLVSTFLYFLIYTSLERLQRYRLKPASAILIGTVAGIASKRLALPISAVCIRQQLDEGEHEASVLDTLKALRREKGTLGLFHVPVATIPLALLPSFTMYFHERLLKLLPAKHRAHPPGIATFAIGAASNALATIPLYPLVLAKAVSMSGAESDRLLGPLRRIYRAEGVAGIYKGLEGQLVKGVIQQGVTMLLKQRYVCRDQR